MTTTTGKRVVVHDFRGWKTVAPIGRMSNSSYNEEREFQVAKPMCVRVCIFLYPCREERKREIQRGTDREGENKESGFRSKQVVTNEKKSLEGTRFVALVGSHFKSRVANSITF